MTARPRSIEWWARLHQPRVDSTGRVIATRQAVAAAAERHVNLVRRTVPPVACDVATKAALLDVDEADKLLGLLTRRESVSP